MTSLILIPILLASVAPGPQPASRAAAWGEYGHQIAARAAVRKLPLEMPAFFRAAEDQLSYLNPEPDRWRDRVEANIDPALNAGFGPDHWVHIDEVPADLLLLESRFDYLAALEERGLDPDNVGTLSFTALELSQRLRSGFRRWRQETDPASRLWIEDRIINDAGILGHYITDASNPHHTSMHHNVWVGENPYGFQPERGFHGRFESSFVEAHVTLEDLLREMKPGATVFPSLRTAIIDHVTETHSHLVTLYRLDQQETYGRETRSPAHKQFAVERLAAGADMLRDIWWSAWVTSELPADAPQR